jgi:hypothetical protein
MNSSFTAGSLDGHTLFHTPLMMPCTTASIVAKVAVQ